MDRESETSCVENARRRVLVIAYHFPPDSSSGTYRTLKFVKYLEPLGWDAVVLTVKPERERFSPRDPDLLAEVPAGTRVLQTWAFSPGKWVFAIRNRWLTGDALSLPRRIARSVFEWLVLFPDRYRGWLPFALFRGLRAIRQHDIDVIYTTAPPHTASLLGWMLHKLSGKPLVSDFRDPWVGNIYYGGDKSLPRRAAKRLEQKVFAHSHRVLNVSPHLTSMAQQRMSAAPESRFVTFPNGFDPADFEAVGATDPHDDFRVTYTGVFYPPWRDPRAFLEAVSLLRTRAPGLADELRAVLAGDSDWAIDNQAWLAEQNLGETVKFLEYQPHAATLTLLVDSDLLLLIGSSDPNDKGTLTGKVFEYLATGQPILALTQEGDLADLVRDSGAGRVAKPDNPEAIADALIELHADIRAGRAVMQRDEELIGKYDRRKQAAQLAEMFESALLEPCADCRKKGGI